MGSPSLSSKSYFVGLENLNKENDGTLNLAY